MRLIDADELYPDCLTKDGTLAISQSQIANALTVVGNSDKLEHLERKKGTWIYDDDYYVCNQCRSVFSWWADSLTSNYCPNCGADMRGKQNDSISD